MRALLLRRNLGCPMLLMGLNAENLYALGLSAPSLDVTRSMENQRILAVYFSAVSSPFVTYLNCTQNFIHFLIKLVNLSANLPKSFF